MNLRRSIQLGMLLSALVIPGALAEEPATTQSAGETGQQADKTGQPKMGGCPMMASMKKQGMMGHKMMGPSKGALFGTRVTPVMNLSVEDVSGYLTVQLDQLNNKRLKLGEVKSEDGIITADIVTVDNSLVQRLKVNRHTGAIDYGN